MKVILILVFGLLIISSVSTTKAQTEKPIVDDKLIFEEKNGMVAVEAELFYKQTLTETRKWYITSSRKLPFLSACQRV